MKRLFAKGPSLFVRLLACVTASICLIVLDQRGMAQPLRAAFMWIAHPLRLAVGAPTRLVELSLDSLGGYSRVLKENAVLRQENALLRTRLLRSEALEQENLRLRGLLETSFKIGEQYLIAELISVTLVPYQHIVVVNKGARFGVYVGQPVLDTQGVAGQVIRVSPLSAEVMLITDSNHATPVQVNRNGLRTIAVGTGQIDRLALPYLTNNADVVQGDLLVSSGLGGTFPQGYPVAKVTRVVTPDGTFANIAAEPLAKLDRVRELLLVWSKSDPIPRAPDVTTDLDSSGIHGHP